MSSIMTLNKLGIKTALCGIPLLSMWQSDSWFATLTFSVLSDRKDLIHFRIRPCLPILLSFKKMPSILVAIVCLNDI